MSDQKWNMSNQGIQFHGRLTCAEFHDKVPALHHSRCIPLRGASPPLSGTVSKLPYIRVDNGSVDVVLWSDGTQRAWNQYALL